MNAAAVEQALSRIVRLRPDIEWSMFSTGPRPTWIARDPVSLEYFHFNRREQTIARMLDGTRSLRDVLSLQTQGGDALKAEWLLGLIAKLENSCLTVPRDVVKNGRRLWFARTRAQRSGVMQRVFSPLAVRLKLFDPSWLLGVLAPVAQLLFGRAFVLLWLGLTSLIGFMVVVKLLQAPHSLSDSFQGITTERALGLVLIYACVKSLHELGHALACKKWNAECHEIGLFFLVFTPCLYCNTSDCWKLSSRWRRACIAAAGIYVELTLAAVAGCVWLVTSPDSVLHLLAANVMVICSLSTVLVNANPLLRYDGYYVLSDLWGVPNLHEQSREAMRGSASAWLTGRRLPAGRWDADPRWLAVYGIAAWIYRHFVVLMIAWVVWSVMDGIGLPLLGAVLILFTFCGVLLANILGAIHWTRELFMNGSPRVWRLAAVGSGLLLACVALFFWPWPTYVSSRAVVTFEQMTPIYVEHQGILTSSLRIGQTVVAGSEIARIESPELELEIIETQGKVEFLQQRSAQLKGRLVDDDSAATELATVIEELAKSQDRLQLLQQELALLVSQAAHDGILIAGQPLHAVSLTELPNQQRHSLLLSPENVGCSVERGALLGWLSRPADFEVTALVVEQDAELLTMGMPVRCRWDCDISERIDGRVSRISPEPIAQIPETLLGDESIPYRVGREGELVPLQPHYEVEIALDEMPLVLSHQSLGTVHFATAPRTLSQSIQRWLNRHVRPDL